MAETPTWVDPIPTPLILYPSGIAPDFAFTSGSFSGSGTSTQWGAAGAAVPTMVTGVGEQLGSAVKFNPAAAASSYIQTGYVYCPSLKAHTSASAKMAWYVRAKCVSAGANTDFIARLDYYDSSGGYISSESSSTLFTCGTTLPADSAWRVKRAQFTPTIPSNVARVGLTVGYFSAGPHTNETYLDWIALGFECAFGDFGPHQLGAFAKNQLKIKKKYDKTQTISDDGTIETTQFSSGLYDIEVETTAIDDAALVKYRYFHDYCSNRSPFMFFRSVTDVSRDFVEFLSLDQEDDGVERIKGTEYYSAHIKATGVAV